MLLSVVFNYIHMTDKFAKGLIHNPEIPSSNQSVCYQLDRGDWVERGLNYERK